MIGQKVSHYTILEKLGEGGMGVVYKAQDTTLNRFVALKFLHPLFTNNEESRKRFITEAQAASALEHNNICNIHEIDESDDGQQFICMAYYEGESLAQKIKNGPLLFQEAINILYEIAEGLEEAHREGIVHLDVKPSNIIITKDGKVKILDFGLAKLMTKDITQTVSTKGTVAYLAPEVISGMKVDHRADLWSLGIILYEMLTGHKPFEGEYIETLLYSIANKNYKKLSDYVRDIPGSIEEILDKLLRKIANNRYQSAEDLLADLEPLVEKNISLRYKATPKILKAFSRRTVYMYGSVVLFILFIFIGINYLFPDNPKRHFIAVLPMENFSADTTQEWLSDGLTNELITELSKIEALRVTSRNSSFQYKGSTKEPYQIAGELNTEYLVDGTVLKIGDLIKLTARMVDPEEDEYIWVKDYEVNLSDVLSQISEIAGEVAEQIQGKLTPQDEMRITETRKVNPEAYALYSKGMYHINKLTPEGIELGINYLKQAIEIDSTDPLPYAKLAVAYGHIAHSSSPDAILALDLADKFADKALAIDENIAEAHLAKAMKKAFSHLDIDGAEKSYKRALEINPSFAYAHFQYAFIIGLKYKNLPEMFNEIEKAKILDPLSPFYPAELGLNLATMNGNSDKQLDKSIEESNNALELDPDFIPAYAALGHAYSRKNMHREAIKYQKIVAEKAFDWKWGLGLAYALAGKIEEANKVALELEKENRVWDTWCIAVIYSALGNSDKMFYWLEEAYKRKHPYIQWIKVVYFFDDYKNDPRFISLTERMNLPE